MLSADYLTEFYEELGRRVRKARSEAGISQSALAAALSLTRASVANLEAGRQRIQVHTLVSVAEALSVKAQELLPGADSLPGEAAPKAIDESFESDTHRRFVINSLANVGTAAAE